MPFAARIGCPVEPCNSNYSSEASSNLASCTHEVKNGRKKVEVVTVSAKVLENDEPKKTCVIRESNPGLYRGRVLFYH